jgi:hypothetical protein
MIENDSQGQRTLALMEGFRKAGFRKAGVKLADDGLGKRSIAIRGSYEAIIRQLDNELREYGQLRSVKQGPASKPIV